MVSFCRNFIAETTYLDKTDNAQYSSRRRLQQREGICRSFHSSQNGFCSFPNSAFGVHRAQTLEEWTSILSLATRWEFSDIRSLAIRSLQSLNVSPVDRIVLSRDFDISGRWTLAAYTTLCERPDPLTFSEASKLGLEDSIRVAQLREQLRGTSRSGGYRSLTRAAAARREPISPPKPPRQERSQWDIGRSFFDQGDISPPIHRPSIKRGGPKAGTNLGLNRTARMVVEVFGLGVGRRSPSC